MNEREAKLVRTFVLPGKRSRYVGFLGSPKLRHKFLNQLYHFHDFDPACVVELAPSAKAEQLLDELRKRGAPHQCFVISTDDELDGLSLDLEAAVHEVFGRAEGTLICCVPGRLAYFEGEPPKNRYILDRRAGRNPEP